MCVISCILKCIMGIVNALLFIMGLVLTVIGALLLWGFSLFMKHIYSLEAEIQKFLQKIGVTANVNDVIQLISNNATAIGAIAFGIGIVLLALAIIGIIAVACCSIKNFLIVILVLLIALTLGLIVLVLYYGVDSEKKVLDPLEQTLQKEIINKYVSFNGTDAPSIIANIIQITVNCCGLMNYSDYASASNFYRKYPNSQGVVKDIQFPFSCCEFNQDFTITTTNQDKCVNNGESKYKSIGCWSKIRPYLVQYLAYAFASIGITIGILIATIIVTIILIKCADKID